MFESPLGVIAIEATGSGVRRIWIGWERVPEAVKRCAGTPLPSGVAERLREARSQVLSYLRGERRRFELEWVLEGTAFQKRVWAVTRAIPYGETRSYGEVADAAGTPGAARAVGNALHVNPLPLVVPCHRVIGKDGRLRGFGAGIGVKAALLALERSVP